MKAILKVSILLVVGSILVSCGPVLYSNVGQNVPLFQNKGEFFGQFGFSSTEGAQTANGTGGKAAYAISDKLFASGSFYGFKNPSNPDTDEWKGKGGYWELGSGLYGGFKNSNFRYEATLGLGKGWIENTSLNTSSNYINTKFVKPFVQPSIGFTSRFFELAITPRIAYLSFLETQNFRLEPEKFNDARRFFEQRNNRVVFEPGLTVRGGYEGIMLELQYSYSSLSETSDDFFVINNEHFSVGVRFLISSRNYDSKSPSSTGK